MGRNVEEEATIQGKCKDMEVQGNQPGESPSSSSATKSPSHSSRPSSSMVFKKAHTVIPPHLVAEAISTLNGLDLRWSGPITPTEMEYVRQYVLAKYPEYRNGLLLDEEDDGDAEEEEEFNVTVAGDVEAPGRKSPSFGGFGSDLDGRSQLEPSKLVDVVTRKSSIQGSFISIPEIQARNRALMQCGVTEDDYFVVFSPTVREAMVMAGESYPFFRGNYYLTIIGDEHDWIREFALQKKSKVIAAPISWLDLRIKGSQLSQYFRRKCKYSPKGLFAYPANVDGTRYSMHWISEAHRNSWHVLLDATGIDFTANRLTLALHRPDFVVCEVVNRHAQPSKITCLLVRRKSFDIAANSA